jgi:hypothetical protein
MNMNFAIMIGYFGLAIVLFYFSYISWLAERQSPEFIKQSYKLTPKPLWQKLTITACLITIMLTTNENLRFIAFFVFAAILCKNCTDRTKYFQNPYK